MIYFLSRKVYTKKVCQLNLIFWQIIKAVQNCSVQKIQVNRVTQNNLLNSFFTAVIMNEWKIVLGVKMLGEI